MHPRVSFALFASPVRWKYFSVLLKWGRRRALATRSRWFSSIFVNFFRKKLPPTREYRAVVIDAIKRAVAMRKKEEVSDFVLFFFHSSMASAHGRRKKTKEKLLFSSQKKCTMRISLSFRFELCVFFSYDFQIFIFGEKFTSPTRNDDRGGNFFFKSWSRMT